MSSPKFAGVTARLRAQFADIDEREIVRVLEDSYELEYATMGEPALDRAEQLARLRLEIRARHPALADGPAINHTGGR